MKLALALVAALLLAGCAENTPEEAPDAFEDPDAFIAEGNNTAPSASITASVAGGELPVDVEFILDATDADGDAMEWFLDVDGDETTDFEGNVFPTSVNYTYTAAGTFEVTLRVSDFKAVNDASTIIEVLEAGDAPYQEFTGTFTGPASPQECVLGGSVPGSEGVTWIGTAIDSATSGLPFKAVFTATDVAGAYFGVSFRDDAGEEISYFETNTGETEIEDVVDESATVVGFYVCDGASSVSVTYQAGYF